MYLFREMETFKDSDAIASQVYKHEDLRTAEAQLYQTMASALLNDNVKMVACDIIAPSGICTRFESDVKPDEPTPTPTPNE